MKYGIVELHELYDFNTPISYKQLVTCKECTKRKKNKFCLEHMRYEKNDDGYCSYAESAVEDETQTNADQHVQRIEYVESVERSRCRKCKHFKREYETPVSSDGRYYTYITCSATKCVYEPKDEPQTERSE